ncbi:MAG: chromate efflux transporter [Nevskia sp.]|nr:chromate efflux transporter [Nevskia sp.]
MNSGLSVETPARTRGSAWEVLAASLRLGLSSFGGPIAHLGYYEQAYVKQRRWLDAEQYAGLVALCQLLPGPASSQTGFLIGLHRAGWAGALAAWIGFTLPSALLMFALAVFAPQSPGPVVQALMHGLKLTAVAVVAQAVWSMARRLCPDRPRSAIAMAAAALLLAGGGAHLQLAALVAGALAGLVWCRTVELPAIRLSDEVGHRTAWFALALFALLLFGLPLLAARTPHGPLALADIFYRSGALVFGGGHVVLPLLRDALVPGWLSDNAFLAGYGAAQALPGPVFAVAAYLGAASAAPEARPLWSALALLFIFLPGLLLAVAGVSLWGRLVAVRGAAAALAGVNAAVVGVLGAALYDPVWTSAVHGGRDAAIAVAGLLLLERWRMPPVLLVVFCVALAGLAA